MSVAVRTTIREKREKLERERERERERKVDNTKTEMTGTS